MDNLNVRQISLSDFRPVTLKTRFANDTFDDWQEEIGKVSDNLTERLVNAFDDAVKSVELANNNAVEKLAARSSSIQLIRGRYCANQGFINDLGKDIDTIKGVATETFESVSSFRDAIRDQGFVVLPVPVILPALDIISRQRALSDNTA